MDLIYLVGAEGDRPVKIGVTRNMTQRLKMLQTGNPRRLHVLALFPGGHALERLAHSHFSSFRLVGEWFDFGDLDPVAEVSAFLRQAAPTTADVPQGTQKSMDALLAVIQAHGGITQAHAARTAGVAKDNARRCLLKLAAAGLIWRGDDKRWHAR